MDGSHTDWRPREHDHVVEPVFAGLHGHGERRPAETSLAGEDARSRKRLWIAAAVAVAAILARAWMLI